MKKLVFLLLAIFALSQNVMASVTILKVTNDGIDITNDVIHFSGPVTITDNGKPGDGFLIRGMAPVQLSQLTPSTVQFYDDTANLSIGDTWLVQSQPNWLATPIAHPSNGIVTSSVPEPSTLLLLAFGATLMFRGRKN